MKLSFDEKMARREARQAATAQPVAQTQTAPVAVISAPKPASPVTRRDYKVCPVCGCTSDDRTFTTLGTVCDDCA